MCRAGRRHARAAQCRPGRGMVPGRAGQAVLPFGPAYRCRMRSSSCSIAPSSLGSMLLTAALAACRCASVGAGPPAPSVGAGLSACTSSSISSSSSAAAWGTLRGGARGQHRRAVGGCGDTCWAESACGPPGPAAGPRQRQRRRTFLRLKLGPAGERLWLGFLLLPLSEPLSLQGNFPLFNPNNQYRSPPPTPPHPPRPHFAVPVTTAPASSARHLNSTASSKPARFLPRTNHWCASPLRDGGSMKVGGAAAVLECAMWWQRTSACGAACPRHQVLASPCSSTRDRGRRLTVALAATLPHLHDSHKQALAPAAQFGRAPLPGLPTCRM